MYGGPPLITTKLPAKSYLNIIVGNAVNSEKGGTDTGDPDGTGLGWCRKQEKTGRSYK